MEVSDYKTMRINWFASLAPQFPRAFEYTQAILPYLTRSGDVKIWQDLNLNEIPWREINSRDLNIYVIDRTNPHGEWIWKLSQTSPGLIVCLSSARSSPLTEAEIQPYRAALLDAYGIEAVEGFDEDPQLALRKFTLPYYGMRSAHGLMSHCIGFKEELSFRFPCPVIHLKQSSLHTESVFFFVISANPSSDERFKSLKKRRELPNWLGSPNRSI